MCLCSQYVYVCVCICVCMCTKKIKSKSENVGSNRGSLAGIWDNAFMNSYLYGKQWWACQFNGFRGVLYHLLSNFLACQLFKCFCNCVWVYVWIVSMMGCTHNLLLLFSYNYTYLRVCVYVFVCVCLISFTIFGLIYSYYLLLYCCSYKIQINKLDLCGISLYKPVAWMQWNFRWVYICVCVCLWVYVWFTFQSRWSLIRCIHFLQSI